MDNGLLRKNEGDHVMDMFARNMGVRVNRANAADLFPCPSLGVRILGEVKKEYADILRGADAIFIEELHNSGWYHKTNQAFAVS